MSKRLYRVDIRLSATYEAASEEEAERLALEEYDDGRAWPVYIDRVEQDET